MQNPSIKYILKLSIPIFFANLAIPFVGIIDTGLMGNLGNLSYLSATSVAANLFSMIFWSFGFLRMGTVGLVSQAYGRKDYSEIFNIVLRNLIFILTIFIILISLQNYIFRLSLNIFDLSVTTEKFYKDYFQIRIWSAPGELTLYIITGLFIGLQKTKISSLAVGLFSILNIILSIIFVTKFDLNIKGVAYGTLFSALIISISFLIYTFWYLYRMSKIEIKIDDDQDSIWLTVDIGDGASCHVGYRSCFYRSVPLGPIDNGREIKMKFTEKEKKFDPKKIYKGQPNPTKI